MSDELSERTAVRHYEDGSITVTVDGYVQFAGDREVARLLANAIRQAVSSDE
jgi:hypothetical protein